MISAYTALPLLIAVAFASVACDRPHIDHIIETKQKAETSGNLVASDPIRFLEDADEFWMTPCILKTDPEAHMGENLRLAVLSALQHDTAAADFERLTASDKAASVLYGLVGLYFCDPLNYRDHLKRVQRRLQEKTLGETVDSVLFAADLPGQTDLSGLLYQENAARIEYGQTLTEYCRRMKQAINESELDFFGGGIPLHFLDPGVLSAYDEELQEKWVPEPNKEMLVGFFVGQQLSDRADFLRVWADACQRAIDKDEQGPGGNGGQAR